MVLFLWGLLVVLAAADVFAGGLVVVAAVNVVVGAGDVAVMMLPMVMMSPCDCSNTKQQKHIKSSSIVYAATAVHTAYISCDMLLLLLFL